MKPSRRIPCFVAAILVLVLVVTASQTNFANENASKEERSASAPHTKTTVADCSSATPPGKIVTIVLHGLMVGRLQKKGSDKRFEVGIVKRAPGHTFSLTKYVPRPDICETIRIPENPEKALVVELRTADNNEIEHDIKPLRTGAPAGTPEWSADYDRILNIEEREGIKQSIRVRYKQTFKPIFRFHHGTVKTRYVTVPLFAKQVEAVPLPSDWKPIDSIAEVAAIDVCVREGQRLVLRDKNRTDPRSYWLDLSYDSIRAGTEIRVLNLPADHEGPAIECCRPYDEKCICSCYEDMKQDEFLSLQEAKRIDSRSGDDELPPTHFQNYYYLAFNKDRPERYELKTELVIRCCKHVRLLSETIFTVPPYRCGMVLINNGIE